MESELDFQKICPKCSRVYKTETKYCRDCGIELETIEPSSIHTNPPPAISDLQTIGTQTSPTPVGEGSKTVTCKNCGVMILAESWRINCPNCGHDMYKQQKTQSKISAANRGFLIAFTFFMGISTSLYYFSVKMPIWPALIVGVILGFIFGDLTRNIIKYPEKSETRKIWSRGFWIGFMIFGLMFWWLFTLMFIHLRVLYGPFLAVIVGWAVVLACGLFGALWGVGQ